VEALGEISARFILSLSPSLLVASITGCQPTLASVFLIGLAIAVLQVAIHPLFA
jgi:hypothetical protein